MYSDKWKSIIANAGCIQAFGIHDKCTADYISAMLGQQTVKVTSKSTTTSSGSFDTQKGITEGETGRPLLMPDELTKLPRYQQVVLMHGKNPMLIGLMAYYNEPIFKGQYDKNPYY